MDSMRHLSTSLPHSTRRRNETDLLASFKSAALSVTNLFKAAAADSTQAREAGYQDALEDLLAYMDNEKIGLGDGEAWSVRRWLLQRIEDTPLGREPASDDGDESQREEADTRTQPAEAQKKHPGGPDGSLLKSMDERPASPTQQLMTEISASSPQVPISTSSRPTSRDFTFRSTTQYPTNHDRETQATMDVDVSTPAAVRVPVKTNAKSRSSHNARREGRAQQPSVLSLNLGPAAGSKRRLPYSDFFDISGITFDGADQRDNNSRGGKRTRQA